VSDLYETWFCNGNVHHLGNVVRRVAETGVEIHNSSFFEYCDEIGYKLNPVYRKVKREGFKGREAEYKSASKYDKSQPALNEKAWALSGEWTKIHFRPWMGGSRVLSEEMVVGELDKTTSAGYPWSLKYKNKRDFLENGEISLLSRYWDILGKEDEMVPIWTCSQKIEMRSVEKLNDNKVRTFTASPIEHSVASNRLYLHMNNKFYDAHGGKGGIPCWSMVGMSKYLSGWQILYDKLDVHPNAFELDESEYDSSMFQRLMWGMEDFRWGMLDPRDQTVLHKEKSEATYDRVVNSVFCLENGELLQKQTGNPSGSPNTVVDNTIGLFRLFAYAWIVLCYERGIEPDYNEFMKNVSAALYGDDNTYTVSNEFVDMFNPTNISRIWTGIGVTTKTPCFEPRKLSEVSFLSSSFVWNSKLCMFLPGSEHDKVLCSLAYGSDKQDIRWHLLRAFALRMDSYACKKTRDFITGYISFIFRKYADRLVGRVSLKNGEFMDVDSIMSGHKSDTYIEALYSGRESGEYLDSSYLSDLIISGAHKNLCADLKSHFERVENSSL